MSTISCYKHSEPQSTNILIKKTASSLCKSNTLFKDAAIAPRGGGGGRDNVAFLQHHANATAEWKARCSESGMG